MKHLNFIACISMVPLFRESFEQVFRTSQSHLVARSVYVAILSQFAHAQCAVHARNIIITLPALAS